MSEARWINDFWAQMTAENEDREAKKTIAVGDRIVIIGGEHWPREGTVAGFKSVQNLPCASVTLDKALPSGKRVVTVLEAHIDKC